MVGHAVSSTSIQLTWNVPETSGETVKSYEIYYNASDVDQNVHITVSPPRNSYLLEDLSPYTLYAVSVTAKATHGESGRSSPITIHTMEAGQ